MKLKQIQNMYSSFEETIYLHNEINKSLVAECEEEAYSSSSHSSYYGKEEEDDEKVEEIQSNEKELFPSRKKVTNVDSIKTVYKIFQINQLATIFHLKDTALKIILTLPVASAPTERSFSKLKIIKIDFGQQCHNIG